MGSIEGETNACFSNKISIIKAGFEAGDFLIDIGKKKILNSVMYLKTPLDFLYTLPQEFSVYDKEDGEKYIEGKFMLGVDYLSDFGRFGISYIPAIDFTNDWARYFSSSQKEAFQFTYYKNAGFLETTLTIIYQF